MRKRIRFLIPMLLLPVLLSGCIVWPWWDGGYGGGHHHRGWGDRR